MGSRREVLRRCPRCEIATWLERTDEKFPCCGSIIGNNLNTPAFMVNPDWEPYISENMDHEPVLIRSKAHWREEIKARGLKNEWYDANC